MWPTYVEGLCGSLNIGQFKQNFATTFKPLTQINMVLICESIILVHFTMLACFYKFINKPNVATCVNDNIFSSSSWFISICEFDMGFSNLH